MTDATVIDRIVAAFSPAAGLNRLKSRASFEALAGGYHAGSRTRDAVSGWGARSNSADDDILLDLPTLRARSRDLVRNNSIAAGAINTKVTNVVGTGLKMNPSIDREFLGLNADQADAWEAAAEREFNLWGNSQNSDIERTLTFAEHQDLAFRATLENGDHFIIQTRAEFPGSVYNLALQHVEADRVCNKDNKTDTETVVGGVQKSAQGAPESYHILQGHPGSRFKSGMKWVDVPAFGSETGRRVTLHLYRKIRAGQTRGVPDLAPVTETLKQISRYTEAEIDAAVKTALFALLVRTETGEGLAGLQLEDWKTTRKEYYKDSPLNMKGGSSLAVGLFPDDNIEAFDPSRPNTAYEPFVKAMFIEIGMALELPAEVMMHHFQGSYSAARGALLQAWQFFMGRRRWLGLNFCQPVYETLLSEAISKGRLSAPGFFADPAVYAAYCGAEWIGDAQGQIDETKAVGAAADRVELGVSNLKIETAALTGRDHDKVKRQRDKEVREGSLLPAGKEQESADDLDDKDNKDAANG